MARKCQWLAATVLSCGFFAHLFLDPLGGSFRSDCGHTLHNHVANSSETRELVLEEEEEKRYCQWTVVAGDSNNRMAFEGWVGLEKRIKDGRIIHQANRSAMQYEYSNTGHHCNLRWADKELLIIFPDASSYQHKCHIISSRFMIDQRQSLARLRANLTNSSYCGSELQPIPLPNGYERPPQPDMVWYTHGFWALHKEKRTDCNERFGHVVDAMLEWKHRIKRVIWQTAFEINYHAEFDNSIIEWDYKCQKKLASQNGIELADIFTIVHAADRSKAVQYKDCHLNPGQYLIAHQYMDRCCGGWENYLGMK
ncbi:expressed unknown protein [Seminavis robusta]|uniref:Uncharacterized protein n=1 Tax=Seminavis robusta TaxID=568900 RepID=A0A9N8H745_9STRA|nr:expressed unknown protein [Seminavis robusta]|eukprot:Sro167_g074330.1 n/a (310) ;mRNA; r:10552-11481